MEFWQLNIKEIGVLLIQQLNTRFYFLVHHWLAVIISGWL